MEPKIRLKGFSGDWEDTTIGNIATVVGGGTPSTINPLYWNGPIQWFTPSEVGHTKYVEKSERTITKDGIDGSSARIIPANSLLLSSRATIGEASINICECTTNQGFQSLVPINVDLEFLYSLMITKKSDLLRESNGSTFLEISASKVKSIDICVPEKNEQQALGSYFQHLDSLIQSTTKKIESLKQVKTASLQSMFPQEGETVPRVRFKGFNGEWEKVVVGKMGTTYSGLSGKTKDDFGIGNARFITFLNVLSNTIIDTYILESVNVSEGEHQNEVRKGDLLFNTSSETPEEVGMCAVMDKDLKNVYLNSFCFGFRITDANIDSTFIAHLMRSHIGRRIMSILAQGATRYNLSKNSFCNTELLLPKTKEEQHQIANYFTSLDSQITLHIQRLKQLKQIKSACLDYMFV